MAPSSMPSIAPAKALPVRLLRPHQASGSTQETSQASRPSTNTMKDVAMLAGTRIRCPLMPKLVVRPSILLEDIKRHAVREGIPLEFDLAQHAQIDIGKLHPQVHGPRTQP